MPLQKRASNSHLDFFLIDNIKINFYKSIHNALFLQKINSYNITLVVFMI